MFDARPVYVAFAGDRFELVEAGAIEAEQLAVAKPEFRMLSITGPKVVGTGCPLMRMRSFGWAWSHDGRKRGSFSAVLRAVCCRVASGDRAIEAPRAAAGAAP